MHHSDSWVKYWIETDFFVALRQVGIYFNIPWCFQSSRRGRWWTFMTISFSGLLTADTCHFALKYGVCVLESYTVDVSSWFNRIKVRKMVSLTRKRLKEFWLFKKLAESEDKNLMELFEKLEAFGPREKSFTHEDKKKVKIRNSPELIEFRSASISNFRLAAHTTWEDMPSLQMCKFYAASLPVLYRAIVLFNQNCQFELFRAFDQSEHLW